MIVVYAGVTSTFTPDDMTFLQPGEYLNENVLDFFISKRARDCVDILTLEVCSTSFYEQLIKPKPLARASNVPEHVNDALQRVNYLDTQHLHPRFFSSSFVFIPVNVDGEHWVLAVVYLRNRSAVGRYGTIIIFNSRQTTASDAQHAQIAEHLRDFMNCHWCLKHQFGVLNPSRVYTTETCPLTVANIGNQSNNADCGLYVIKAAEAVMNHATEISERCLLSNEDLEWLEGYFEDKVVLQEGRCRGDLRKELREMSALTE